MPSFTLPNYLQAAGQNWAQYFAYVDAALALLSEGFWRRNAVINGGAQIQQRGAATIIDDTWHRQDMLAGRVEADTVGAGTFGQATAPTLSTSNRSAWKFSGLTTTGVGTIARLLTRIEAADARRFRSAAAVFSCIVRHDVGSNVTFTLYARSANAEDNFSAVTDIGNNGGTAVATATDTRLIFSIADMTAAAANGIELEIRAAVGAVTTKNIEIGEVQLEEGTARSPFEVLPVGLTRSLCERHYEQSYADGINPGAASDPGRVQIYDPVASGNCAIRFRTTKRTTPAITGYSRVTGASGKYRDETSVADFDIAFASTNQAGTIAAFATSGAADEQKSFHYTASAELLP